MREQEFGLQARRLHALFGQKFRAFLNRFQNGHGDSLNRTAKIEQAERNGIFRFQDGDFSIAGPGLTVRWLIHSGNPVRIFPDNGLETGLAFPRQPQPAPPGATMPVPNGAPNNQAA